MAAEPESEVVNAEQRVREAEAEAAGGGGRPRFHPIIVGVMRPPPPGDGGLAEPLDRIVLVNPLTQGMVVLQGNPELVAELLSGREGGGPPPASRASIEAMRTVEVGKEAAAAAAAAGECPVCLDELAGAEAVVVKEMPCRHRFHGLCIEKWLGMHGSCPVCRFRMPAEEEGGSKKGGGGGGGEEGEADGERRRRRDVWVTVSFRRGESRDRHQDEAGDAGDREAD